MYTHKNLAELYENRANHIKKRLMAKLLGAIFFP